MASLAEVTAGRGSIFTEIISAASLAICKLSAITQAKGSPTNLTLSVVRDGRAGFFSGVPSLLFNVIGHCKLLYCRKSSPVITLCTPIIFSASAASILIIFPWAIVLRIM